MRIQYTLKVYPAGLGRSVYRTITICGTDTLDQLCMAILSAFDFTAEHLYEFCMDNKMYSEDCYRFNPMKLTCLTKMMQREPILHWMNWG